MKQKGDSFPGHKTQAMNTPIFTITADGSHSTHSQKCLIFPAQTARLRTHTGGAEGAGSPAPLSDEWDFFDDERRNHISSTEEHSTVSGHPGKKDPFFLLKTFALLPSPGF